MSNQYSYKYLYSSKAQNGMAYIYISSNNPSLNVNDLPNEFKNILEEKMSTNPESRKSCSFLCRSIITKISHTLNNRSTDGSTNGSDTEYCYKIFFGRYGTCRNTCKSLLRPHDFSFNKFNLKNKISSGLNTQTYIVSHIDIDKEFIMEIFSADPNKVDKIVNNQMQLIDIGYNNTSKYLMPTLGVCYDNNNNDNNNSSLRKEIGIVMPKYDITLQQYLIEKNYNISDDEITKIGCSLIHGIKDFHNWNNKVGSIVHRNINMDNIYGFESSCPEKEYLWTIGNYRNAKYKKEMGLISSGKCVYNLMAPEQIIKMEADSKSDIWSIGVIMYQLISKKEKIIPIHTLINSKIDMNKIKLELSKHILGSLVAKMLNIDMDKRPSGYELVAELTQMEKDKIIRMNECRCCVPSSFRYISFENL